MPEQPAGNVRVPPQFLDGERAILGALLLDNGALPRVADTLDQGDFYREAHRMVFRAMLGLYHKNEPVDWMTLTATLKSGGLLEKVGGHGFLAELSNAVPSAANVMHYVKVVKQKALLRKIITEATEIQARCWDGGASVEEIQEQWQRSAFDLMIQTQEEGKGPRHIKEVLKDRIDMLEKTTEIGIMSGLSNLDKYTLGFRRGDFILIAGRPSMGKTALLTDIVENAVKQTAVMVFSIEMGAHQYVDRHLAKIARINLQRLRHGNKLAREEWSRIIEAAGTISEYPLFIDPSPDMRVSRMIARVREVSVRSGRRIGLVGIDYFQLMQVEAHMAREQGTPRGYSAISQGIKRMAKELDVPVLLLCQLNRKVEERPFLSKDKKQEMRIPMLSDLRDTGSLEQDADLIIFTYRPAAYSSSEEHKGKALAVIGKHRNGPLGRAELTWFPEICTFKDRAREHEEASMEAM